MAEAKMSVLSKSTMRRRDNISTSLPMTYNFDQDIQNNAIYNRVLLRGKLLVVRSIYKSKNVKIKSFKNCLLIDRIREQWSVEIELLRVLGEDFLFRC